MSGYVRGRDAEYIGGRMLEMELPAGGKKEGQRAGGFWMHSGDVWASGATGGWRRQAEMGTIDPPWLPLTAVCCKK